MSSQGVTPSPSLPANEKAGHRKFGKRKEATDPYLPVFSGPHVLDVSCQKSLGLRFVTILYDTTSRMMKADEAKQHQFFKQSRGLEIIPLIPTKNTMVINMPVGHTKNYSQICVAADTQNVNTLSLQQIHNILMLCHCNRFAASRVHCAATTLPLLLRESAT